MLIVLQLYVSFISGSVNVKKMNYVLEILTSLLTFLVERS